MHFKRIKELREASGNNKFKMAGIIGISEKLYSKYEDGECKIPVNHIIKIADYFDISVDYIIEKTDIKVPYPKK